MKRQLVIAVVAAAFLLGAAAQASASFTPGWARALSACPLRINAPAHSCSRVGSFDSLAARSNGPRGALTIASAYANAGEADTAMTWLEQAYAARLPQVLHVPANPAFDWMHDDPRFRDLLRRIGVQSPRPR